MSEKILMKGNEAIGEGAVLAGCRHYFGYPITPQTELTEFMAKRMPLIEGTFLQAESEIAAINMVFGASAAGARVMTSSSGPGISLKQEGISYIAAGELPCVIVNIGRGGPGLGTIQPGQGDYFQATKGGGHGDYYMIVLAPNSPQEMLDFTALGFDLADQYLNPVMILGDGAIGQMMEPVEIREHTIASVEKPWALKGLHGRTTPNKIRTLMFDTTELEEHNKHLQKKYALIREQETRWEESNTEDAELVLVAYGITSRIAQSAMERARAEGMKVGLLRPITLWPFPVAPFERLAKTAQAFLTLELSAGQMIEDVLLATKQVKPVHFYGRTGGVIPAMEEFYQEIVKILKGKEDK